MTTTLTPLKWQTVINGKKKIATTHFGTQYRIEKNGNGTWFATVTVLSFRGEPGGGTEFLVKGATHAQARKAAIDDYTTNGGR